VDQTLKLAARGGADAHDEAHQYNHRMSLLRQAPSFAMDEAVAIARDRFGLEAAASPLTSERDQNFHLRTTEDDEFVLKIANATDDLPLLLAQNAAMGHLASRIDFCPRVVPDTRGAAISAIRGRDGAVHHVRLLTWRPGVPMGSMRDHSDALLEDLGRRVAQLDAALASFDDPAIHRRFYWDLAEGVTVVRERRPLVGDAALASLVDAAVARFVRADAPLLSRLPRSAIHNDANEYNVLVRGGQISGIIDFGDMVHGWTVGDLAVAIAYASLDKPDPMAAAETIVRGYEAVRPLDAAERAVLPGLVRLRLAMSICIAAAQQRERPGDEYLVVSQEPIRRTLPKLLAA
jgi:Ser/Thr protein kinase RdoA (MazF antagonist)